jgi:hypothetical protein
MKWLLTITWSKLMALIFQVLAFVIDMKFKTNGTVFMFCMPFSVFLITGKQYFDSKKKPNEQPGNN